MKSVNIVLTALVCITIMAVQSAYMVIPSGLIPIYNMAFRPVVYGVLAASVFAFIGFDKRPIRDGLYVNMTAMLSIPLLGVVMLIAAIFLGTGSNLLTANINIVLRNLWDIGSIVIFGEFIRYNLIKKTKEQHLVPVIIALTVVLAFGHMNAIRVFFSGGGFVWAGFFESIFRPLVISAAASYFVIKGGFLPVLLVSFVFTMTPYLLPAVPNVSPLAFSLLISGTAFAAAVVCSIITNEKRRSARNAEKRGQKYAKRTVSSYVFDVTTIGAISIIIAFFAGAFPIYPIVVLTGSMSGTFDAGSIVFVERVPTEEAFVRVGEGDVVHFISREQIEIIHRVVDFGHDADGSRHYITQGDANEYIDPFTVQQEDILGIARASLPFLGHPYIFFRNIFTLPN